MIDSQSSNQTGESGVYSVYWEEVSLTKNENQGSLNSRLQNRIVLSFQFDHWRWLPFFDPTLSRIWFTEHPSARLPGCLHQHILIPLNHKSGISQSEG